MPPQLTRLRPLRPRTSRATPIGARCGRNGRPVSVGVRIPTASRTNGSRFADQAIDALLDTASVSIFAITPHASRQATILWLGDGCRPNQLPNEEWCGAT
jgi:hypothetical protein